MDAYICTAIAAITASINLINIGTGKQIYKGIDGIGRREIRSLITTGTLLTSTQNTNDITFTIDTAALDTFIEANQLTYSVANIDPMEVGVYAGTTVVGDNTQFNLRTFVSDDILIEVDGNEIRLSLPTTTSLPDFIVNQDSPVTYADWLRANTIENLGTPVLGYEYKGFGTLARPFVDTTVYLLNDPAPTPVPTSVTAYSSIQNALDAYVGVTLDPLQPEFFGSRIKVQPSTTTYTFKGNLNYHGVKFNIQTGASVTHDPVASTGEDSWFVNLDHSDFTNVDVIAPVTEISADATLYLTKNGFKNKGTFLTTPNFTISKIVYIRNAGQIIQTRTIDAGDTAGDYRVLDFNAAGEPLYGNDGHALADIRGGKIHSKLNPILKHGGHIIDCVDVEFNFGELSADIDPSTFPYENLGGAYTRMERCQFYNFGIPELKTLFYTRDPDTHFLLIEPLLNGSVGRLLEIDTHLTDPDQDPVFTMYNATNKDGFNCSDISFLTANLFGGRTAPWKRVYFNNNYIAKGTIDDSVDLTNGNTQGCINFIGRALDFGRNLIEYLPRFTSRVTAIAGGAEIGTRFTKYTTVTSGSFVVGEEYKIVSTGGGTTNFMTEQSASSNAVGTWFVATVPGTGTGTADKELVEILT